MYNIVFINVLIGYSKITTLLHSSISCSIQSNSDAIPYAFTFPPTISPSQPSFSSSKLRDRTRSKPTPRSLGQNSLLESPFSVFSSFGSLCRSQNQQSSICSLPFRLDSRTHFGFLEFTHQVLHREPTFK